MEYEDDPAQPVIPTIPPETIYLAVLGGAIAGAVGTIIELPILILIGIPALMNLPKP